MPNTHSLLLLIKKSSTLFNAYENPFNPQKAYGYQENKINIKFWTQIQKLTSTQLNTKPTIIISTLISFPNLNFQEKEKKNLPRVNPPERNLLFFFLMERSPQS